VRAGVSLGMILVDVDNFKQFNDLYGHPAGDACLKAIARSMPPLLNRPGDIAARYGGEEIALLLPGTTLAGARGLAERVAYAVRKLAIPHAGSPHGIVTISAGVEAFVPVRDVDTAALLVEHADLALYAAKRAGRDTVLNFSECTAEAPLDVFED
jgi:diguanylate cyclase (GGDEF)-like protein